MSGIFLKSFLPLLLIGSQFQLGAQTLLYKITGSSLPQPSYLFGTMHTTDDRVFQFSDSLMPAFRSCESFAMEMDMDNINPLEAMASTTMKGKTLKDLYTEEEYARINIYFKDSIGMSLLMFQSMKPLFTAAMIEMKDFGSQHSEALDLYLHGMAKDSGMLVHGLETLQEQMAAVDKIPLEDQAKMLLEAIDSDTFSTTESEQEKLIRYYANGRLDSLMILSESMDLGPEFERELLTKRNATMVRRMIPLIKARPTFVAVGALHLPGGEGIIKLLSQEGFRVSPVY